MKKTILFVVLAALVLSPLMAQTKLDVKTKMKEKFDLKGVKHGVIFYLEKDGFKIVDLKPEYAVWLVNFDEKKLEADKYTIALTIKIETPKLLGEGDVLAQKDIKGDFTFDPKTLSTDQGFVDFIKAKVKDMKEKDQIEAMQVGKLAADEVKALLATLKK
jgi:hypothetical protein